jgi:hypothetical protein
MRQLFKVAYTIIGILLAIFIVVKVVNSLKSTKPPPNPNDATTELEKYTSQLKDLEKQMKANIDGADTSSPICFINKGNYATLKNQIEIINEKVMNYKLVENIKDDADGKKAKNDYESINLSIESIISKVKELLPCGEYCYQGNWSDLNCECKDPYPIPIIYKDSNGQDRVYCWSDDCELHPHKQFIPGSSTDPSTNQCKCLPGFSDVNGNCIEQKSPSDQELTDLTATMKTDTTGLGFFFCKVSDGDKIVTDLGALKDKANELMKMGYGIISKDTIDNYNAAQQAASAAVTKYNTLQTCDNYCGNTAHYDEKSNTCICNDPNSTFDKMNGCTCKSGYEPGLNACVPINNPDTDSLIKNTASILQFTNDILNKCTNCITTKTFDDKITLINGLKIFCEKIINTGIPSKASVDAYNTQVTNTKNSIQTIIDKKLPDCGDYCWQATYNETNNDCECPTGTTKDVNPADGRPYCYNCGPNSSFVFPSRPSKDPSSNTCACNSGYCKIGTVCEDCKAKLLEETALLNTDYDNIQTTITNNFNIFGELISGGKIPFVIKPRSNILKPLSKNVITVNTLSDCVNAANSKTVNAFSFLPGSLSNNCILYAGNPKNTVHDETSIYGYKA